MKYLILVIFIGCAYGSAIIRHPKIVGGRPARNGQFPYHAALTNLSNDFLCSAAIISDNWLLTAAWCTFFAPPTQMKVVVGTVKFRQSGYSYAINRFEVHPNFVFEPQKGIFTNDNIALIKIAGSFQFGDNVRPVLLSNYVRLPAGLNLKFTGWGITMKVPPGQPGTSEVLQHITLKSITIQKCEQSYHAFNITEILFHCTATEDSDGPCINDLGGPLVLNEELVGIDHSSIACYSDDSANFPNLFTNIGPHRSWIKQMAGV